MRRTRAVFFLTLVFIIFLLPLAVLLVYSLASRWQYPDLLPAGLSLRAYKYVLTYLPDITLRLFTTTAYSICTVAASLFISYFPARVLAYSDFPGKHIVSSFLLVPALLPPVTFAVGIHIIFIRTGLSDSFMGLVLVLTAYAYPYMLRALISGFHSVDRNFVLCSRNLGGGPARVLFTIELPMLFPAIYAGGSVVFLVAFSEYFLVSIIGGGVIPSYTTYVYPFIKSADMPIASLLNLLFLVVPIVLFIAMDHFIAAFNRKRGLP